MSDERTSRSGIWDRAYQVGVVVRDLEQAVAFYERLGIGPFEEGPSAHTVERKGRGALFAPPVMPKRRWTAVFPTAARP